MTILIIKCTADIKRAAFILDSKFGGAIQFKKTHLLRPVNIFSHTRENSKMFNITSNYFRFFNNKPPVS